MTGSFDADAVLDVLKVAYGMKPDFQPSTIASVCGYALRINFTAAIQACQAFVMHVSKIEDILQIYEQACTTRKAKPLLIWCVERAAEIGKSHNGRLSLIQFLRKHHLLHCIQTETLVINSVAWLLHIEETM